MRPYYNIAVYNVSSGIRCKLQTLKKMMSIVQANFSFFDNYDDFNRQAQTSHFDLLLLGSRSKGGNFDEQCVQIKQSLPDLPLILLLKIFSFEEIHKASNSGADDCLYLDKVDSIQCKTLEVTQICENIRIHLSHEFERMIVATIGHQSTKRASDKLAEQLTKYDELIGIPNRSYFLEILEHAFEVSTRWQGDELMQSPLVLVFIDIERIDSLRSSLEMAEINLLYVLLSSRIKEAFYHFDTLARWSENRFVLLLENNIEAFDLAFIINKLQGLVAVIEQPFSLINKDICVGAHLGVCIYGDRINSAQEFILGAEIASAQAARDGGMCCRFNSAELNKVANERGVMAHCLQNALKEKQLQLYFQPVVDCLNSNVCGAEALLRWQLDSGDWVNPEKIILLAEELGLMIQLGDWILDHAVKRASEVIKRSSKHFKMAINIAPIQLKQSDFVEKIQAICQRHQFDTQNLILEITETQLMQDMQQCIYNLNRLREQKIGIAIDDFGTGHSSLEYLSRLPISILKIDRSFVNNIENNEVNRSIIKAIIGLADSLDLKVIAEGVENSLQLEFLRERLNSKAEMQGYYFSKPMPFEQLLDYIDQHEISQ